MMPHLKVLVLARGVHVVDDVDADVELCDPAGEDQFSFCPLKILAVDGRARDRPPFHLARRELEQGEKSKGGRRGRSRKQPTVRL